MRQIRNKNTPKVVDGRVQNKNNHQLTPNYWNTHQCIPQIDREDPGKGYRHVIRRKDILDFIEILPDWNELSRGLDAILLARGRSSADGWYTLGVVGICAWEKDLWKKYDPEYFQAHQDIFNRLEVPFERIGNKYLCKFSEKSARAYQLLHIFLHELGHHHDRITTKSMKECSRGESYAEAYSLAHEEKIWSDYIDLFGIY